MVQTALSQVLGKCRKHNLLSPLPDMSQGRKVLGNDQRFMECKLGLTHKTAFCDEMPGYGNGGGAVDIRLLGFRKALNTVSTTLLERSCGSTGWKTGLSGEVKIGWTAGLQ